MDFFCYFPFKLFSFKTLFCIFLCYISFHLPICLLLYRRAGPTNLPTMTTHDPTDFNSFPWVFIITTSLLNTWAVPILWNTSKSFRNAITSHHLHATWKIAKITKKHVYAFKLIYQRHLFKKTLRTYFICFFPQQQHLKTFYEVLETFYSNKTSSLPRLKSFQIQALNLSQKKGDFLLEVLLRMAAVFINFDLGHTLLFNIFCNRIDRHFLHIKKHMASTTTMDHTLKNVSFTKAVAFIAKDRVLLERWASVNRGGETLFHKPSFHHGDNVWALFHLWTLYSSNIQIFSILPALYHHLIAVFAVFIMMSRSKRRILSSSMCLAVNVVDAFFSGDDIVVL